MVCLSQQPVQMETPNAYGEALEGRVVFLDRRVSWFQVEQSHERFSVWRIAQAGSFSGRGMCGGMPFRHSPEDGFERGFAALFIS
jgi:hypothetical protein